MDSGDTSWVLTCAALVLLMTPGLALFYGGMVRAKNVLNMIMMSFVSMGAVTLLWMLVGYSLAFTGTNPVIGTLDEIGMSGLVVANPGDAVPEVAFSAFQLMFAIITVALISGALADRVRFGTWAVFTAVWTLLVYVPVARWAFYFNDGEGGWIADHLKALDFAGGTVVEINSGAAALALAIVVGPRLGWRRDPMRPHNLPLVLLGAGLLWFGWLGFNAGSALGANQLAAVAFMNTQIAMACGALAWVVYERVRSGTPTTLGIATGAIAGGVAITPAAGYVDFWGAVVVGLAAGVATAFAVGLKYRFGYDDSLDVVGVHGVGGIVGTLLIGLLATASVTGGAEGLLYGGGLSQLGRQLVAVVAVAVYSFGVTFAIGKALDRLMGFRVGRDEERAGLDQAEHAENAYDLMPVVTGRATRLGGHVEGPGEDA